MVGIPTKEYPENWNRSKEEYYPVNNGRNQETFKKYKEELQKL
jgi:UDP-galactopyranose mutase